VARLGGRAGTNLALIVAGVTLIVAWGGLLLTHRQTRLAVPKATALHAVLSDSGTARLLTLAHWDHYDVTPVDRHYELLGFYRGARMTTTVTVGLARKHLFIDGTDLTRQKYAFGSNIANDLRVLALLSVVFVLMTAVWPLWRLRNLDVLVLTSTVLSVVLFNEWLLTRMVLVTYPALLYLAIRCGWLALGRGGRPASATALFDQLTASWSPPQRIRVLRLVAGALVLVVAMVGVTSLHVLDVGYAVMEGATAIVHGMLPYGHISDVLHGDTYPIGSYLFYTPFAWLSPVYSAWDDADLTLVVAVVAALIVAAGLWRMTPRSHWPDRSGSPGTRTGALRALIAVLAFPPLLVSVSTGTTDVALAAMLVGAFLLWHRPAWSMAALSAAAWFKAAPVALLPPLLARLRGRSLGYAIASLLLTSALMVSALLALGGIGAPALMLRAISFQFTRSSPHTVWAVLGSMPLQQLAEATTLALIVGAAVRARRDPSLAGDRRRMAALVAAVLLGLQISASYWNYMYLVWAFPFLALSMLIETRPAADRSRIEANIDPAAG
jgi:hypothetical protein